MALTTPRDERARGDGGFTLIELLVVIAMTSALMVAASFAVQRYAVRQQIRGASDSIVTQLREVQERAVAVSHPAVFGAWLQESPPDWGPVEYVPDDPGTPASEETCVKRGERNFDTGPFDAGDIVIPTIELDEDMSDINAAVPGNQTVTDYCAAAVSADGFIFFFSRGDATGGDFTIRHTRIDQCVTISVSPITSRVRKTDPGPCA